MIDCYTWTTDNGYKPRMMLEETRLAHRIVPVNLREKAQMTPEFMKISPGHKIPAIIDHDGPGGATVTLCESGAILKYLAEKSGKFYPSDAVARLKVDQWLFYGSYYGGVWVTKLTDDGRTAVGDPTMVAIDNKFEGTYVVRRGGYWYFFGSTANCCAGPTTGYSVQVGRSRDLRGPYVDREGMPLLASRAGGTPTLMQNGNTWIGPGHNAIATDVRGRDFIRDI